MNQEKIPWYREPYVWLLIAFPLLAVVGGFITLGLAIASNDGLVVDDYYKEGLMINRVLKRDQAAADLGLEAELQLAPQRDRFTLSMNGKPAFTPPGVLKVSFLHATRKGFDQYVSVDKTGDNIYTSRIRPLIRGHWYVQIETDNWRLLKSVTVH